jgi:hypothetical protein
MAGQWPGNHLPRRRKDEILALPKTFGQQRTRNYENEKEGLASERSDRHATPGPNARELQTLGLAENRV